MVLYIWRHPKPIAANGFCIGQTDISVDKRKIKRLANKIQRFVRFHQLPKVIWVSPLQRSLKVGEILAPHGFQYHVAPELAEIDFGGWDGRPWAQIPKQQIDDWCDHFADFAPKGGESLQQLFERVENWLNEMAAQNRGQKPVLAVGHAGWINAASMIAARQEAPKIAADWPQAVNYLQCRKLVFQPKKLTVYNSQLFE
ncbi:MULTISPECIES: histidine phosphatase family protein [Psychrobacter]|uniref:histidine phosphatase family protein n=1 Tax=Psychrobacter TaxID=497 RepID=UPI001917F093|nr:MULTISPECIES: histidine phosphatase family protein [Psychrobacter]WLW65466.1 histidine phosphatase family protein [Psychrobacter sp. van23A]